MGKRTAKRPAQLRRAALAAIYARVPRMVACKGLCHDACTSVQTAAIERQRIIDATGVALPEPARRGDKQPRCTQLDADNRCRAYRDRPLVCRLWGASEAYACGHGCETAPGQRVLGIRETMALMAELYELSGEPGEAAKAREVAEASDELLERRFRPVMAMMRGTDLSSDAIGMLLAVQNMLLPGCGLAVVAEGIVIVGPGDAPPDGAVAYIPPAATETP
jgi:Fe-S-cluster containining protein